MTHSGLVREWLGYIGGTSLIEQMEDVTTGSKFRAILLANFSHNGSHELDGQLVMLNNLIKYSHELPKGEYYYCKIAKN